MRQISLEIPLGPFTIFAADSPDIDVDAMPPVPLFLDGEVVHAGRVIAAEVVGRSKLRVAVELPEWLADTIEPPEPSIAAASPRPPYVTEGPAPIAVEQLRRRPLMALVR